MKAVLLSACSNWCEKIVSGEATVRACKSMPSIPTPFKCYIYCTKGKPFIQKIRFGDIAISNTQISNNLYNGKVIGEFVCDWIAEFDCELYNDGSDEEIRSVWYDEDDGERYTEIIARTGEKTFYGWHISDLKIYDKPKELSGFFTVKYDNVDYCIGCPHHETSVREYPCCECVDEVGNRKYLSRPPQSWMYVQESEE